MQNVSTSFGVQEVVLGVPCDSKTDNNFKDKALVGVTYYITYYYSDWVQS